MFEEVGHEHDGALEHAEHDQFFSGVVKVELSRELGDSPLESLLAEKNSRQLCRKVVHEGGLLQSYSDPFPHSCHFASDIDDVIDQIPRRAGEIGEGRAIKI